MVGSMKFRYSRLATFLAAAVLVCMASPLGAAKLIEDLNQDGRVDIVDITIAVDAYGSRPGDNSWNPNADVISNGRIDVYDIVRLAGAFGMCVPVASFSESAHTVPAGTPIEFNASTSFDPDGTITLYEWDWQTDDIFDCNTTSPEVVSHSYEEPGLYNVTLRVTDNDGLIGSATATMTVTLNNVVPEIPLGTIGASIAILIAIGAYFVLPRTRKGQKTRL